MAARTKVQLSTNRLTTVTIMTTTPASHRWPHEGTLSKSSAARSRWITGIPHQTKESYAQTLPRSNQWRERRGRRTGCDRPTQCRAQPSLHHLQLVACVVLAHSSLQQLPNNLLLQGRGRPDTRRDEISGATYKMCPFCGLNLTSMRVYRRPLPLGKIAVTCLVFSRRGAAARSDALLVIDIRAAPPSALPAKFTLLECWHYILREPAELLLEFVWCKTFGPMNHEVLETRIFCLN
jgi:hypothetical protein